MNKKFIEGTFIRGITEDGILIGDGYFSLGTGLRSNKSFDKWDNKKVRITIEEVKEDKKKNV